MGRSRDIGAEVSAAIRDVRPRAIGVDLATARERNRRALFGTGSPTTFGRYELLDRVGSGAMGVVYAGHDPQLDRKVAVKVLHSHHQSDRAHEQLIAEARTLARLDHPNVVKVHDVLAHEGQIGIVMAWVDGVTLDAWEATRARPWREVVAVYRQAGEGLAAAHSVGVVHRDFKPANAMVDAAGRVHVLDFGLAHDVASLKPLPSIPAGTPDSATTADGSTFVGTLAYAPPEQLRGAAPTPASDQFSFAVALFRALYAETPFEGSDGAARLASIEGGPRSPRSPRAPSWLHRLITRALIADPAARWRSMQALLAELDRPRGWRRSRVPLALATAGSAAALLLAMRISARPAASCEAESEGMAGWTRARADVAEAFDRIGSQDAYEVQTTALQRLDAYASQWSTRVRQSCVAHRDGLRSDTVFDSESRCLQHRIHALESTAKVLARTDAPQLDRVLEVVNGLPAVETCTDLDELATEPPLPWEPARRRRVAEIRDSLVYAQALDREGRTDEAVRVSAEAESQAEASGDPGVIADASLVRGHILLDAGKDRAAAIASLRRAAALAFQQGREALGVESNTRRIYLEQMETPDLAALDAEAAILGPISLHVQDHFVRPLLFLVLGAAAIRAENRAKALEYLEIAREAMDASGPSEPELINMDDNIAMVTADPTRREQLAARAWQQLRQAVGARNIMTFNALEMYAHFVSDVPKARALASQLCAAWSTFHADAIAPRIRCFAYAEFLAEQAEDNGEAARIDADMESIAGRVANDTQATDRIALERARTARRRGDLHAADALFASVASHATPKGLWEDNLLPAEAEVELARDEAAPDRLRGLDHAIAVYRRAIAINEAIDHKLRLANAERLRARFLGTKPAVAPPP